MSSDFVPPHPTGSICKYVGKDDALRGDHIVFYAHVCDVNCYTYTTDHAEHLEHEELAFVAPATEETIAKVAQWNDDEYEKQQNRWLDAKSARDAATKG